MILIDSGAIIAYIDRRDEHHKWIEDQMAILKPPFYTCESVISESCFILTEKGLDVSGIFTLLERGALIVSFELQREHQFVALLLKKYRNLPMDVADACLVTMAENEPRASVLTTDGDFLIYRKSNRQIIPCLMPEKVKNRARRKIHR